MSEMAEHVICEKFEANIFAKSRCQNCFRTVAAHQCGHQELKEEAVKTPDFVADAKESSSCDPWDPLCILVPQCELYVCVGSEDRTESWQESLEYTQLSRRAEEELEEPSACPDDNTLPGIDTNTNDTLSRDWEMTRLLDSILGSDKGDMMYYAGQKQEVQPESLHSDRPRWAETTSSGRTESWSRVNTECRAMSQDYGDSWRKHQAESSYFSLERQKSDPTWASSPPRPGHSALPVRGEGKAAGGWPASSVSSADSDTRWRTSGSSEGRHGLMREEYTVLADLPKPKRLNHRQAFEKDRSSPRTRSPGRAEVERIFGLERRKSETLEAFQALEEGLLERLDSKTLKLAKEGRLVRRQSSPTLRKEVNKKLPWEPGQPSRSGGESLRLGRPGQRPDRTCQSQGESRRSGSPAQQPERERRNRGTGTLQPAAPQRAEREKKKREEPAGNPRAGGERAPFCSGRQTDSGRKGQPESGHPKVSGKNTETKWKSCLDALHVAKPAKSIDKSQVSHRRPLERYKESDRKARGKPLLPVDTAERLREDSRDRQEATRAFSPGRGTAAGEKTGRAPSPPRHREVRWGAQGETRGTVNSGRDARLTLKSHGDAGRVFSPGLCSGGSQRETRHSLSPGRCRESNWKNPGEARHSPSPGRPMEGICACSSQERCCAVLEQYAESSWKSQREVAAARDQSDWPSKGEILNPFTPGRRENGEWKGCSKCFCPASVPVPEQKRTGQEQLPGSVRPENSSRSQEGSLCHVHPMQLLERQWTNQGERLHSAKPGQPQLESNWRTHRNLTGWSEENDQMDQGRCSSPMRPELQVGNSWNNQEKLFHQHQLDGRQPMKSTCFSRSQDPYLDTSKKHKPDLLNFKKGWMSILNEPGEWTKHWFVLTDSSLKYYRDSNAEEADDLDGEIDLRTCTDVTEYAVQRNYGFQIHTKDGVFTLSAMTSGIRRNWIEALRKSIRPASVPDVTKLSDCNKENSFRSYGSPKSSVRSEEQRPSTGPEVISRGGSRKGDAQHHAFDYVELSPLHQGSPLSQGSPQRTRGSVRSADSAAKREELERDLAFRSEERRKWFESPTSGVLQTDGPVRDLCQKAGGQESPGPPLSEAQKSRLSEEIEKKWQELERLPLKDSKRVPLMALLNQGQGSQGDKNEALEKEVQALRSQLESFRAHSAAKSHRDGQVPRGYISQEACERSLAEMETSHQQVMAEMQRHHQREMERLQLEKERLLAEEAAATAAAIEALKKAHRDELNKELGRTRIFQKGGSDAEILQQQHQSDVESLKRELQVLSEQYSQKCLEIGDLVNKAEEQEQMLQHCQQEGKELLRQNQELQRRLSEEIGQLRAFITAQASSDGTSHNSERNSCELEVLLRVKENELQYLKQEVQCLRDEIQMMQKDKRFASGKYQDVYAELNHIKRRSEREIEQLKEHLRLAMAALQEKEMMHNSIG